MPSAWRDFKARTRQYWTDYGLTEWQKAAWDALRDGQPIPQAPIEHHYRKCRDEDCPEDLCRAYKEALKTAATTERCANPGLGQGS